MKLAMNKSAQASFAKYKLSAVALVLAHTTSTIPANAQIVKYVNSAPVLLPRRSPVQNLPNRTQIKPQKRSGRVSFVQPKLPSTGIPSGRQRGAAGRGNCLNVDVPLTALVPAVQKPMGDGQTDLMMTNIWGLTAKSHPTLLFYIPYANASAQAGEFVLQDEEDNDIYRTMIALPPTPSVVKISLAAMSAPLEIGEMYRWYFKVRCTPNMSAPIFVEGWMERIALEPKISDRLAAATPLQKIDIYAENGIWYDTVADLAQMRVQNPANQELEADWQQLLQSVGLADIQSEPVVTATLKNSNVKNSFKF